MSQWSSIFRPDGVASAPVGFSSDSEEEDELPLRLMRIRAGDPGSREAPITVDSESESVGEADDPVADAAAGVKRRPQGHVLRRSSSYPNLDESFSSSSSSPSCNSSSSESDENDDDGGGIVKMDVDADELRHTFRPGDRVFVKRWPKYQGRVLRLSDYNPNMLYVKWRGRPGRKPAPGKQDIDPNKAYTPPNQRWWYYELERLELLPESEALPQPKRKSSRKKRVTSKMKRRG
jgi:hypothetical protein